jgi:N-methylhydantoinase B/oxoprolinase/acetone carboxylase alpha subunit
MMNKSIVNVVIAALKEIEINGEMMEHIIDEVGMRDQMIKQLTPQPQDVIAYDKDVEQIMVRFTRKQLINFTREVQERCKQAMIEAVNNAGIDGDDYVELELDYNNTIQTNFDDRALIKEIGNVMDDVIMDDDDSVLDEACNVLDHLAEK